MTNDVADKILCFLAYRLGFTSWKLEIYDKFAFNSLRQLVFFNEQDDLKTATIFYDSQHIVGNHNEQILWHKDNDAKYILDTLFKQDKMNVCALVREYDISNDVVHSSYDIKHVFKQYDTIESLLVESDLM